MKNWYSHMKNLRAKACSQGNGWRPSRTIGSTRGTEQLLFVEALGVIEGLLGGESKQPVGLPL